MENRRQSSIPRQSSSTSTVAAGVGVGAGAGAGGASRFGFRPQSSTTTNGNGNGNGNGIGVGTSSGGSGSKRSSSAAGLHDSTDQAGNAKRLNTSILPSSSRPTSRASSIQPRDSLAFNSPSSTKPPVDLEYRLNSLKSEWERKMLGEQSRYQALERESMKMAAQSDRLRQGRVELMEQWNQAEEERNRREEEWEDEKEALQSQLSTLRSQHSTLTETHNQLLTTHSTLNHSTRSEIHSLTSRVTVSETQNRSLEAETASLRDELEKERKLRKKVEEDMEDVKEKNRKEILLLRDGGDEGRKLGEELSRQTSHIRKLESSITSLTSENKRLKSQSSSISILQEEKLSLESKLSRFNSLQDELVVSKSDFSRIERELSDWKSQLNSSDNSTTLGSQGYKLQEEFSNIELSLSDILSSSNFNLQSTNLTPDSFASYLDSLRGVVEGLKLRSMSQEERIKVLKHSLKETNEEEEDRRRKKEEDFKNKIRILEDNVSRSSKVEVRLNDEISKLNQLLKSYESESEAHKNSYEISHGKRTTLLEEENESKRKRIGELEDELKSTRQNLEAMSQITISTEEQEKRNSEKLELKEARTQLEHLEVQLNKLMEQNLALDSRLRRGEFNPEKERCLVLADNPVSRDLAIRTSTLEALKNENSALLKRVDELSSRLDNQSQSQVQQQQLEGDGNALVPRETADNLRLEIKELNDSMKAKDKAMLRLKQVFTAKASEYRESVQSLFGYKIKFLDNGKVRLKSVYARSSIGTTLVFRSDEGNVGSMQLLGEANQEGKVEDLRRFWLGNQRQSVPCFLAALNMELYDMTTQAGRAAYIGEDEDEE